MMCVNIVRRVTLLLIIVDKRPNFLQLGHLGCKECDFDDVCQHCQESHIAVDHVECPEFVLSQGPK